VPDVVRNVSRKDFVAHRELVTTQFHLSKAFPTAIGAITKSPKYDPMEIASQRELASITAITSRDAIRKELELCVVAIFRWP